MTQEELIQGLADELERRGIVGGVLLADVIEARRRLAQIDTVLRRIQDTLVTEATTLDPDPRL